MKRKEFTRKPYSSFLYKWSPDTSVSKNKTITETGLPEFCNATPFSQGEDWKTTYVYEYTIINGVPHHGAYVECGYVE